MPRKLTLQVAVLCALVGALAGCGIARPVTSRPAPAAPTSAPTATAQPSGGSADCSYVPAPSAGGKVISMPPGKASGAKVRVQVATNLGALTLDLAGDAAPCTVNSFLNLARAGFYDNTRCHRLTAEETLYVLQCGDPSGTGTGGPGYSFSDENLPTSQHPPYPRGTVAMANAGPATNGSQFFLVYKDTDISPNYSVFGTVTGGLDILDGVAAGGTDDGNGPGDGHPKKAVTIQSVKVS
jgi:peptidyl-prolyl cis-trans isomerase B (cyclophilin B)